MNALKESGEAAILLLKAVESAADAFPPLKSAVGGALYIAELTKSFKSSKKEWAEFAISIQMDVACVVRFLPDTGKPLGELEARLRDLKRALDVIAAQIVEIQQQKGVKGFFDFAKNPEKIVGMRRTLDDALKLFHLANAIGIAYGVETLKSVNTEETVRNLLNMFRDDIVATMSARSSLDSLPYAAGASWQREGVCLSGTRSELLKTIQDWIHSDEEDSKRVMWICESAGVGKSSIAHSLASACDAHGMLASSFFFDRKDALRNSSERLFSTIIRDLADTDPGLRDTIGMILSKNRSLASASPLRQLQELIIEPLSRHPPSKRMVIIVDGLDEGLDTKLLRPLRDNLDKLPKSVRLFVTSRPVRSIIGAMATCSQVSRLSIDLYGSDNLQDILHYSEHRLRYVAEEQQLDPLWPGEQLLAEFVQRAEGLFLWVFTVSQYLSTVIAPERKLLALLHDSGRKSKGLLAEAKMDQLYAEVLGDCPWDDEDFCDAYSLVLGAIIAAKVPISSSALLSLHREVDLDVAGFLRYVGAVLIGADNPTSPIRILHLSFIDFITTRANSTPSTQRFFLNEKEHSQRMALLCLHVLNEDFASSAPLGTGYLEERNNKRPIPGIIVSESVNYACRFWLPHVLDYDSHPSDEFISALRQFLSVNLVTWLEVVTSVSTFQSIVDLQKWLQTWCPNERIFETAQAATHYVHKLQRLCDRLEYDNRLEEAWTATSEGLQVLGHADPGVDTETLRGHLLNNLSFRLSDLGRHEEALKSMEESIKLYRALASNQNSSSYNLAMALANLANELTHLKRWDEALAASEESVKLRRELAIDDSEDSKAGLALSLNNYYRALSAIGRREDAVVAIRESLDMYRDLSSSRPDAFTYELARALSNLSVELCELGQYEESLGLIEQSLRLHRELATSRPTIYLPDVAVSLNNRFKALSVLGRRAEALSDIQECTDLYRDFTKAQPAVFRPRFATALNNLSMAMANLNLREKALAAAAESVEVCNKLAAANPTAYRVELAGSLNNFSKSLSELGRHEEALAANKKCVKLYRELVDVNPGVFNYHLALTLNNLSSYHSSLGHYEEALSAIKEAVTLRRTLAEINPDAFRCDLGSSLCNISKELANLGHHEEALNAIQEAVDLFRQLRESRPTVVLSYLSSALGTLCNRMSELGRLHEAVAANEESVQLYRELAKPNPPAFLPELARALNNLSNQLSNVGRHEESLLAIEESTKWSRQLAADLPDAFLPTLAMSLLTLSSQLSGAGRGEDALSALRESLEFYRKLVRDHPATYKEGLAKSLNNLCVLLFTAGDSQGALEAIIECASVLEELYAVNPSAHRIDLANAYNNRSILLTKADRHTEALAAKELAVKLFRELAVLFPARYEPTLQAHLNIMETMARAALSSPPQSDGEPVTSPPS